MNEEKREKTRVDFKTEVILNTGTSKIVSEAGSRDISVKGVFIYTDQMIPIGTPCDIEVILTGTSSELSLKMKGKVARQDSSSGLGIIFDSIDFDSYFHLKNILMYNAADPDAIEDELLG